MSMFAEKSARDIKAENGSTAHKDISNDSQKRKISYEIEERPYWTEMNHTDVEFMS